MNLAARLAERMRALLRKLVGRGGSSGDVFRHMLVLAAGSSAAKAIGMLSIPIVTRLYTPDQYGLFTLFLSTTALLTPLASLRYSAALPLPRSEGTAAALLLACVGLLAAFLALMALVFGLFADRLFGLVSAQALAPLWPLLLAAIGTAGLYEILTNWAVRQRNFRAMARAEVAQSLMGGGLKIGLALLAMQRFGLVTGHIVAQIVACTMLALTAWREAGRRLRRSSWRVVRLVTGRYADFPRYRLPSQMLLTVAVQAPVFFVGAIYGPATAGQLGLALVALAVPLTLIGQTTGQAYYGEIARIGRKDPEQIQRITRGVTKRLAALGLIPTLVLMFAGPWLFPLFFGARWHDAGIFAAILSIYLLAQFIANPLGHALSVLDKQHIFLRFNAARVAIIGAIFGLAYWFNLSAYMTIAAYSVALTLHYATTSLTIFAIIRRTVAERLHLP